jgi:chitin disaccharide deacetylase
MKTLARLGFPKGTKLVMIHADDAGLCHSENKATAEGLLKGSVNSCSIMPACPGFGEMAEILKANPQWDYGVHLTLTCEWKNYKWGPVLPVTQVPSLVNDRGHFYSTRKDLKTNARIEEVKNELIAQIEKVYQYGLTPSHLDSHMYTVGVSSEFLDVYKELGLRYRLPVQLNKQLIASSGTNPDGLETMDDFYIDEIILGNYSVFEQNKLFQFYADALDSVQEGLTVILIHPAFDNQDMKDITIDHPNFGSAWRQIDFDFFTSELCKMKIAENNLTLITWREIKNILIA